MQDNLLPLKKKSKTKKKLNKFLEYEKDILRDTIKSSLNIFSEGLNIQSIILQTIKFYLKPYALTFIINYNLLDSKYLTTNLNKEINFHSFSKIPTNSLKRKKYYERGGVYLMNSTTLLIDLINNLIEIKNITCLIILNVEKLKISSKESFIINIFNLKNKTGILKGFTETPTYLINKYFPINKLNEILKISEINFFPRFRDTINFYYKDFKSVSKTISLKLYSKLEEIQIYLIEVINKIIRESGKYFEFDSFQFLDIYYLKRIGINFMDVNLIYKYKMLLELLFIDWDLFMFFYFQIKNEFNWGKSPEMRIIQEIIESVEENEMEKINKKILKLNQIIDDEIEKDNTKKILILCENTFISSILNSRRKDREDIKSVYMTYFEEEISEINEEMKEEVKEEMKEEVIFMTHNEFKYEKLDKENDYVCILLSFNLSSIRLIERQEINPIIIYYRNTFEEEKYLNDLRLEKEAFEKLIKEYSNMPKPSINEEANDIEILIDCRELKSSLPFSLFKNGFKIQIEMLEMGDYILNKTICIERKSIFDLMTSLKGRLYSQLKRMTFNYESCYLLIEFPSSKLSIFDYSIKGMKTEEFLQKFLILIIFFNIKIIYSSDNQMSIKYLKQIPIKQLLNKETDKSILMDPKLFEIINSLPFEGIKSNILAFKNLKELILADREKLKSLFKNGDIIYNFFHSPFD